MLKQIHTSKSLIFIVVMILLLSTLGQTANAINIEPAVANWTNLNPLNSPPKKNHVTLSYDSSAEKLILFGGRNLNGTLKEDTWTYSVGKNMWEYRNPSNSPPGRQYSDMTYISQINKSAVFGGATTGGLPIGDFWLYDHSTNSWEQVVSEGAPSKRSFHKMDYSPVNNILVLSGGHNNKVVYYDTWIYDFNNNQWLEIGSLPAYIESHAMVYYPPHNSMLLYHGNLGSSIFELNLTSFAWNILETTGSPGVPKHMIDMVYDPVVDKVILFGGYTGTGGSDETWLFDYDTLTWYLLETQNRPPSRHTDSNVEYDTENNVTLMFGGSDETIYYDDTWSLSISSDLDVSTLPTYSQPPVSSSSPSTSETNKSYFPTQILISLILFPIIRRKYKL